MTQHSSDRENPKSNHQALYAIPLPVVTEEIVERSHTDKSPDLRGFGASASDIKVAISEILDRFYNEVSQSLEDKNLKWEAEIELGIDFGFAVKTKIKISPKG
jgi:hypothetical protein